MFSDKKMPSCNDDNDDDHHHHDKKIIKNKMTFL